MGIFCKTYGTRQLIFIFIIITLLGCNSRTTPGGVDRFSQVLRNNKTDNTRNIKTSSLHEERPLGYGTERIYNGLIEHNPLSNYAAAGNTKLFERGTSQSYQLTTTVVLNEPGQGKEKEVGYRIQADVGVGVVWQNDRDKNEKLLEIELKAPKLLIKSRKAPTPEGFDVHKSELEKAKNFPFLVHWRNGKVVNVHLDTREELSMVNLKKGIASLFQFQVLDLETKETDASGNCRVTYKSIDPFSFSKTKSECVPPTEIPTRINSDPILSAKMTSTRTSSYKLTQDLSALQSVTTHENHQLSVMMRNEVGSSISASQYLTLIEKNGKAKTLTSPSLTDAVKEFGKTRKLTTSSHGLDPETFSPNCDKEDCPSLPKLLKENREYLSTSSLGTLKSANAFVRLLSAARVSTKDDLTKAFKGSKNKEILAQLCDLAGAIQLPESHEVMMKIINFDSEEDLEKTERYLWSLAAGSHPHEAVLKDIYKISQRPHPNEKVSETLALTLAAMAHRFSKTPGNEKHPLLKEITRSILGELELCKEETCKVKYLRALGNLKCPHTIPELIKHALNGNKKSGVEAMKGLRSFEVSYWNEDVLDAAQRIYFQAGRKYDSSSRTLALDILLESNPRREILQEVVLSLVQYDPMYEVKQYLVQRVKQISEKSESFSNLVNSIIKKYWSLFNNYDVQAQRGLTTAFSRSFASDENRNGSLSTVLEISKGLLKRGIVDVVIETPEKSTSLFTLGLFAGGLNSFVSSDDEKEETNEVEEEAVTAGMELSVLGAQIRPFVFFNGQGELMGHVWSGTASEKTPAYQALILVIDHLQHISLQNGFLAEIEVLGAASFDLSGQIQISLWNRNAYSLVEKNAGISLQGRIRVDSSFVRSKIEFNVVTEMKLNLQSDLNFYSGTSLCMQLSQPEVVIKHNVHKIERIPGGKHRLRKSKYSQISIPGRSYALNRKNNEMCNLIFN